MIHPRYRAQDTRVMHLAIWVPRAKDVNGGMWVALCTEKGSTLIKADNTYTTRPHVFCGDINQCPDCLDHPDLGLHILNGENIDSEPSSAGYDPFSQAITDSVQASYNAFPVKQKIGK